MKKVIKRTINIEYKKGFTVMEALLAFSILVIAFTAFLSSTTVSMKAFQFAEDYHLANEIAKEGLELVISKKDNHNTCVDRQECNDINHWRENLPEGNFEVSACRTDELLPSGIFSVYSHSNPFRPRDLCVLEGGDCEGIFGYCTGAPSGNWAKDEDGRRIPGHLRREIVIENIGGGNSEMDPDGILVKSIVRWGKDVNDPSYEIVLETRLYEKDY